MLMKAREVIQKRGHGRCMTGAMVRLEYRDTVDHLDIEYGTHLTYRI